MHIVTLSFDDGFRKSNSRIAEIYEKYGLSACFNVTATGELDTSLAPDKGHNRFPTGDFGLWNELQARGHEVMPHGYKHANKAGMPFTEARELILDCLDVFASELEGFKPAEAIFNFPYNASTPELEAWLPDVVKAFRCGVRDGINPLPHQGQVKLVTTTYGPDNCEEHLNRAIDNLLARPSGWLIYNTHGVDGEGWGPIRSDYLDRLLAHLLSIASIRILPTGKALSLRR